VYAVFGNENYLKLRAVQAVIDEVLGSERDRMALVEFDGETAQLADVLDECRTPSLLSSRRLVIIREADPFLSEHRAELEKYLTRPSATGSLVLECRSWARTTRLYKLVEQIGRNIACEAPARRQLPRWVMQHAREVYGCTIDASAVERLVDLVGEPLGLLDAELGKLATFVWPRTVIPLAAVEELVGASREETVFGIAGCVAQKDVRGALALWDQVLSTSKGAPYWATGGLRYSFRKLADAKRLVVEGVPLGEVARRCQIYADPPKLKRWLERFSLAQWRRLLVRLLQIDVGSKSGRWTVESAVERLIVELCCT